MDIPIKFVVGLHWDHELLETLHRVSRLEHPNFIPDNITNVTIFGFFHIENGKVLPQLKFFFFFNGQWEALKMASNAEKAQVMWRIAELGMIIAVKPRFRQDSELSRVLQQSKTFSSGKLKPSALAFGGMKTKSDFCRKMS